MSMLHAYLSGENVRQADFAARLGISQGMVSRLVRNAIRPSLDLAFAIERETGGAVPAASWVAEPSAGLSVVGGAAAPSGDAVGHGGSADARGAA